MAIPGLSSITDGLSQFANFFTFSVTPKEALYQNSSSSGTNISEIFQEIRDDFQVKFDWVKTILKIIQTILLLPLLLVPWLSHNYLQKAKGLHDTQGRKQLDKFFAKDAKKERRGLGLQFILLLTHGCLTATIFTFDQLLFWSQGVAREFGSANFTGSGGIQIKLDIRAGPVFQPFLDTFLAKLSHERSYNFESSTQSCLPNPMLPSGGVGGWRTEIFVIVLYFLMMASFGLQSFTGMFKRRVVMAFLTDGDQEMKHKENKEPLTKVGKVVEVLWTDNSGHNQENKKNAAKEMDVKMINNMNRKYNEGYF